jgi:hypothetical protein
MKLKNVISGIILVSAYLLIFSNTSYSEDTIPFLNNDTMIFYKNSILKNNKVEYKDYSDMELVDKIIFTGYLVIQFDSSTIYEKEKNTFYVEKNNADKTNKKFYTLGTTIFWVKSIDKIDDDSCRFYYYPPYVIMLDGVHSFQLGEKDDLSIFLYYLDYFNRFNNVLKLGNICYLYAFNKWLNIDDLNDKPLFKRGNEKVKYVIFETHFQTAVVKYKSTGKKILIPTSILLEFEPVYEDSYVNLHQEGEILKNYGFVRVFSNIKVVDE